ncbi:carboxylesterase family protein [Ekhidna sp.]
MNNLDFIENKKSSFGDGSTFRGCAGNERRRGGLFSSFSQTIPSALVCVSQIIKKTVLVIFLMAYALLSFSQTFTPKTFKGKEGNLPYQILLPENFSESENYPVVLFLHGAGERGSNNEKQLVHGSTLFLNEENRNNYPAIVIFPQCPKEDYWANVDIQYGPLGRQFEFLEEGEPTVAMSLVLQLMDSIASRKFVNNEQIYIGGLSMGGMGTFEFLARRPDLFAAAFPICGGGNPNSVKKYAGKVDLWIFHGAKDDVVFPHHSVDMALALQKTGATPRFTLYREANHNSWDRAFAEPELLSWLFSQTKRNQK